VPTSLGLPPGSTGSHPDWLTRNWKWALPVGVLVLALGIAAFIGAILVVVESSFQHSDCYVLALARTRSNLHVGEKIGQPITPGWFATGNINVSGSSGNADISIPISGPKGKGTIYLVAQKRAGNWTFETLQVEIDGEPDRIDLLERGDLQPSEN